MIIKKMEKPRFIQVHDAEDDSVVLINPKHIVMIEPASHTLYMGDGTELEVRQSEVAKIVSELEIV